MVTSDLLTVMSESTEPIWSFAARKEYNLTRGRSMSQDTRIGSEIAGYRIESLLGRGGMSVVYLATQEFPKRKVALKLLAPELVDEPGFRERFIRESNAAASLDHPNVIPIYGAGEENAVLWIAMRYVEGTDLAHLIQGEGALPPQRTVHIIEQVASALDAAHEIGLVHRDVKPGNILLARSDHAYLADFGITKRREAGTEFTKTGDFLGSVDYAAPEQIKGEEVDGRADVYSLGCVAYECLTGESPFARDSDMAVLYAHVNDPLPRPTAVRADLPEAVDAVVAGAMAKSPAERYPTASEMTSAIGAALASPVGAPPTAPSTPAPDSLRRPARRRRALVAVGVAILVVAAATVVVLTNSHRPAHGAGSSTTPGSSASSSSASSASPTGPPVPTGFSGVAKLDPATGRVATSHLGLPSFVTIQSFGRPLAAGEGAVWVSAPGSPPQVVKVNPTTGAQESIPLVGQKVHFVLLAVGNTSVWAFVATSGATGNTIFRIDPATDVRVAHIPIPSPGIGVAVGPEGVWALGLDGVLYEIDAGKNRVTRQFNLGSNASGLALGDGFVWVADNLAGVVYRFDPATGKHQRIQMRSGADGVAADANSAWVMDRASGTVTRIDPTTGELGDPIRVGEQPSAITVGGGAVWVADAHDGTVWKVDEVTGVAKPYPVATNPGPSWVSYGEGGVWSTVG
jgi:serine/threonine protein kinase